MLALLGVIPPLSAAHSAALLFHRHYTENDTQFTSTTTIPTLKLNAAQLMGTTALPVHVPVRELPARPPAVGDAATSAASDRGPINTIGGPVERPAIECGGRQEMRAGGSEEQTDTAVGSVEIATISVRIAANLIRKLERPHRFIFKYQRAALMWQV